MALQSKPQLPKQPALLTLQEMNSGIERLKKRLEDVNRFEPRSVIDQFNAPALDALGASIDDALVRTFGADTLDYERYKSAKDFERGPYNYRRPYLAGRVSKVYCAVKGQHRCAPWAGN